jgi:PilZ domain
MPELVRSIIGRLSKLIGSHHHARRHDVRLPLTIYLNHSGVKGARVSGPLSISGYTHNISDTGLSLVVSSMHCGNRYLMDGELSLRIQLELPDGAISFSVAPECYDRLGENPSEWGYLVGMRIIELGDMERNRLTQYLRQGHPYEPGRPKASLAPDAPSL